MMRGDSAAKSNESRRLADLVSQERLWNRHIELAKIGATEAGGVNREALTAEDSRARLQVIQWATDLGAEARMDDIGNLFLRYPGIDPDSAAIMTGSHLDSQPTGGMFDGTYGVLAGLEVLEALAASGRHLSCPVDLVIWMNEEGSRFSPATMGSGVHAGVLSLEDMLGVEDRDGVVLADALAEMQSALGSVEQQPARLPCSAYLETHIEQGPVLESGKAAHAGTTPRSRRKDALMASLQLIGDITASIDDADDQVRFTVGRFELLPGTPNTVPASAVFSIDLRHPDEDRLNEIENLMRRQVEQIESCTAELRSLIHSPSISFDADLVQSVADSAQTLGLTSQALPSGATHDAASMARLCPSAMIFVPCRGGESHNESEWAEAEHLWAGACVLADVIDKLGESAQC